ncbi:hypothetical protein FRZ03_20500 [Streptomyces misionensis]|uniref:Uncharacterized protein n=1 Tax=Streptomyces misionensis TaxID=67331 RepID=A0A5C6JJY0_9ACTN|nr:hypothetical protein FRZ03_20500 [Streptomyces misionensis]
MPVLAARVGDAHAAKVWLPLGFTSWEAYCGAEWGPALVGICDRVISFPGSGLIQITLRRR